MAYYDIETLKAIIFSI